MEEMFQALLAAQASTLQASAAQTNATTEHIKSSIFDTTLGWIVSAIGLGCIAVAGWVWNTSHQVQALEASVKVISTIQQNRTDPIKEFSEFKTKTEGEIENTRKSLSDLVQTVDKVDQKVTEFIIDYYRSPQYQHAPLKQPQRLLYNNYDSTF